MADLFSLRWIANPPRDKNTILPEVFRGGLAAITGRNGKSNRPRGCEICVHVSKARPINSLFAGVSGLRESTSVNRARERNTDSRIDGRIESGQYNLSKFDKTSLKRGLYRIYTNLLTIIHSYSFGVVFLDFENFANFFFTFFFGIQIK